MIESVNSASTATHVMDRTGGMVPQDSAAFAPVQSQVHDETKKIESTAQSQSSQPSQAAVSQAVDNLNKTLMTMTHLRFRLHEDTHRYYVEIVDTLEDKVIREVPPKKFLDLIAAMYRFMGFIVDEKR